MRGKKGLLKLGVLSVFAYALFCVLPQIATAEDKVDLPYDWVIKIETRQLQRQFDYKNSALNPVEKLEVSWHPSDKKDEITKYQYMWYHEGKPLGMEKFRKLDITEGEGVAIQIVHKDDSPSMAEKRAAANAALRLAVDTYLHRNPVAAIKVPLDSFDAVSNHLMILGFHDAKEDGGGIDFEPSVQSDMTLHLYSEPDGKSITLIR